MRWSIGLLVVVVVTAQFGVASAEDRPPPELSPGRLVGEFAVGTGLAVGVGYAGAVVGAEVTSGCVQSVENGFDERCQVHGMLVGAGIGATLGAATGVYLVGVAGDQTGSFLVPLGGAAVGIGVTAASILVFPNHDEALAVDAVLLPVMGALIGFNVTRHFDDDAPMVSLVPTRNGFALAGTF